MRDRVQSPRRSPRTRTIAFALLGLVVAAPIVVGCIPETEPSEALDPGRVENGSMTVTWSDNLPLYSRDGTSVAFVTFRDGRWVISAGPVGTRAEQITSSDHGDGDPSWSPDGSRLVYHRLTKDSFDMGMDWDYPMWAESEGLYIVDRDGSDSSRLTDDDDVSPCWSADGKTIVFERWRESGEAPLMGVYTIGLDEDRPHLVARGIERPACSPTAPTIAVDNGEGSIIVLDLRNGKQRVVASKRGAAAPAWSPDGSRLAFAAGSYQMHAWKSLEIYVVNADGTGLRRLTRNAYADAAPAWTPNERIVFKSFRPGMQGAYVMNSDGTRVHRIGTPQS